MSENRDEILANFQACTGIEDLGEAIAHLEEANWDLLGAINRAIPQDVSNATQESSPDIEMVQEVHHGTFVNSLESKVHVIDDEEVVICNEPSTKYPYQTQINMNDIGPSTSSHSRERSRTVKFNIEYNEKALSIELTDGHTVGDLKRWIMSQTEIPICRQILIGWSKLPRTDSATLASLNLNTHCNLTLKGADMPNLDMDPDEMVDRLKLTYTLNIHNECDNSDYSLKFPALKSILEVKADVYTLTNIPIRFQHWTGWPQSLKDESTLLACSGINYPTHSLTLKSSENTEDKKYKRIIKLDSSDDSSVEEFEDAAENFTADDDMFISDLRSRKLQPLIPDMVEDETAGCLNFADEFASRYGPLHPEFFPGTLDEAMKEACIKPARERRLLAVYLHHDRSVLSNVFCAQILCCESVVECLTANFVIWGWDLTFEWNSLKFFASLSSCLGQLAALQIKNIPHERLPALVIISRVRSATEISAVVQGNVGVSELMAALTEAVDVFTMQQKIEIREEDERMAREMIMFEQDAAYRQSLEMDRAKEEAKKQQEMIQNEEKERAEQEKKAEDARKEATRLEVQSRLPAEPTAGSSGNTITKVRVRLPKGEFIERQFYVSQPLQDLLDYLLVQGYPALDYKVISSWPRRDLTSLDCSKSFGDLKLCPQETVILEER